MAELAIRGHAKRSKEVIEILKMFGGKNDDHYVYGSNDDLYYYIASDGYIYGSDIKYEDFACQYNIFTLEEFLEKFPYKVGDRVQSKGATSCGTVYVIERMEWTNNQIEYEIRPLYDYNHTGLVTLFAEDLQPYQEDTMETITIDDFKANTKEWLIDKLHGMIISHAIKTIGNIHGQLHPPK